MTEEAQVQTFSEENLDRFRSSGRTKSNRRPGRPKKPKRTSEEDLTHADGKRQWRDQRHPRDVDPEAERVLEDWREEPSESLNRGKREKELVSLGMFQRWLGGETPRSIARELDCAVSTVQRRLLEVLHSINEECKERAELMQALEGARLEALLSYVWPKAKRGNLEAVREARAIVQARRQLYGLDKPLRLEVDARVSVEPARTVEARIESLRERRDSLAELTSSSDPVDGEIVEESTVSMEEGIG